MPSRIPSPYTSLETLRSNPQGEVHRAKGPHGEVALRISRGDSAGPGLAELEVLAAIDHPGLARLAEFGRLESGATWIARSWIPGEDLDQWATGRAPREIGRLIAELADALQHLHDRGFLHGDLKPGNVIVDPAGAPHLTDFGLARREGASGSSSGSLFFVAPEHLAGLPLGTPSDLFALGVTLHSLLLNPTVSAERFYSRFPQSDYFRATETSLEDLPEWSRELLAALLQRDPTKRPASAHQVAAILRARLELPPGGKTRDLRLHRVQWSPLAGREDWLNQQEWQRGEPWVLEIPAGDSPHDFAQALRLWLTLRGFQVDHVQLDPDQGPAELKRTLSSALHPGDNSLVLLTPGESAGAESQAHRALQTLTGKAGLDPADPLANCLLVTPGPLTPDLQAWPGEKVPRLDPTTLDSLLRGELGEVAPGLAEELADLAGGSLEQARSRLERGFRRGDFAEGETGPQLRKGARPESWGQAVDLGTLTPALGEGELDCLAALEVMGGEAPLEDLVNLLDLGGEECRRRLGVARDHGLVRLRFGGKHSQIELLQPLGNQLAGRVPAQRWQALYGAWAARCEADPRRRSEVTLCQYAASPDPQRLVFVLEELRRLVEAWKPGEALEFARGLETLASRFHPPHRPRARAEVAVAYARLGQLERATALLAELESEGTPTPETNAAIERSRGVIAHERHDFKAAAEHLKRARALNPSDGGESLFRQAQLAWERRAEEELAELHEQSEREAGERPGPFHWNVRALMGLSLCRQGKTDEGLQLLESQLEDSLAKGDRVREAKTRLNLATVIRRTGRMAEALDHLDRAIEIHREENHLPALAQAQAMLGGTLRGEGRLEEAAEALRSAFELRERFGDDSGAMAARGMLGFVLADGGQLRSGLDELEAAARSLREARRTADAGLLEARALELRARIQGLDEQARSPGDPAPDPRVLIGFARAYALWGRPAEARDLAQRALALAEKLKLAPARFESEWILHGLDPESQPRPAGSSATPRVQAELDAWQIVVQTPDQYSPTQALELAQGLGQQGYLDLASRLAISVSARAETEALRKEALGLARNWLEAVERGLTHGESTRCRTHLLGLPDPRPQECLNFQHASTQHGVIDLDIISLLDINHRLVEQEDLPSLLPAIVESALTVARGERGFLVLERDGEIEFDTARHSCRGDIPDPELEVSSSVLTRAFNTGETVRLSNAGEDPVLAGAPSVEQLELRSILVTPFTVDRDLRGAIYVDHRLRMGAFSERAEQMLELLATQAALAIRQVRRLDQIRSLNGELKDRVKDRERQLARAKDALEEMGQRLPIPELVGSSEVMGRVRESILRAAPSELPVLVCGDSGTGKELAAQALHANSRRSEGPFIAENCAALPASLIESELFGYRKGAFTGADRDRAGIFERADGGTLFLDEIGELPMELQAKLLRVLETGELRRVGDTKLIRTNFRLVAATNRDLQAEVLANRFRSDLMYRLDALRIEMPNLRAHEVDIPELVLHFLDREEGENGLHREVSPATMAALCRREWPGNVRELQNEVKRLCVLHEGDLDDPSHIRPPADRSPSPLLSAQNSGEVIPIAQLERQAIENALRATGNDKRKAASLLGISRAKLYQRLKEWASEAGENESHS